ncbi:MAG: YabP/YqfC family sporulation protein [Clostridium sp.]
MASQQRKSIVSALNLPEDVFAGEMILTFIGSHEMTVENYRSIVFYTDTILKLQGKRMRLTITGIHLMIEYYDKEELKLTGRIKSAEFEITGDGRDEVIK